MSCCCTSTKGHGLHYQVCPNLWSKQKKISVLEQELQNLQEKENEIKELIMQLKSEN